MNNMVEVRFKPGLVGTVPDGSITEAKLANDSVTAPKIKDGEVGNAEIAADAAIAESKLSLTYDTHDTKNIAGSRISGGDIVAGLVADRPVDPDVDDLYYATDEDKVYECLVDDAWVEATHIRIIKDDAITGAKILDGEVAETKLAADAVTADKIKDGEVVEAKLANLAVTEPKLAADAVTGAKIKDGEVVEVKLADGAVGSGKIKVNAIIGEKIADGAVINLKIGMGAVTLEKVAEKTFVKSDSLSGNKKVIALGYDTVTEEIVLDHEP